MFDKALRLKWLKRYLTSKGKWKVFVDVEDVDNFGLDFVQRMSEIIQIPFWNDVIDSLKLLFKSGICNDVSVVCSIPLSYDNILRLPLKPLWLKKRY